jgi:hypothetical protein
MELAMKSYWIKRRYNPQFKNPYYVLFGQLTKKDAKQKEKTLYGDNLMLEYKTLDEYQAAIKQLKKDKFDIRD